MYVKCLELLIFLNVTNYDDDNGDNIDMALPLCFALYKSELHKILPQEELSIS